MGFRVEKKSKVGLGLADGDESGLNESKDSRQMTMNLAASSQWDEWDYFWTMTGNQAQFPGIRHLHQFKESMEWTRMFPNFDHLLLPQQREIKKSYEMAYTSVLGRCWMEARKLVRVLYPLSFCQNVNRKYLSCLVSTMCVQWLEYIAFSATLFFDRKALNIFFRDEYQASEK